MKSVEVGCLRLNCLKNEWFCSFVGLFVVDSIASSMIVLYIWTLYEGGDKECYFNCFPGRLRHFICRPRGVCISVIIILAFGASHLTSS